MGVVAPPAAAEFVSFLLEASGWGDPLDIPEVPPAVVEGAVVVVESEVPEGEGAVEELEAGVFVAGVFVVVSGGELVALSCLQPVRRAGAETRAAIMAKGEKDVSFIFGLGQFWNCSTRAK